MALSDRCLFNYFSKKPSFYNSLVPSALGENETPRKDE